MSKFHKSPGSSKKHDQPPPQRPPVAVSGIQKILLMVAPVVLTACIYYVSVQPRLWDWWNGSTDQQAYNQLASGFASGHLYLKADLPKGFDQLPDPLDSKQNAPYLLTEKGSLWDLSYYRGHLFMYYGSAPTLLLHWPYHAITGRWLSHRESTALFFLVGFSISMILLWMIRDRYFPHVNPGVVGAVSLAAGLAGGIPLVLPASGMYEVASSCAWSMFMLCLLCLWQGIHRNNWKWIAAAGLAYGLSVGSRAEMLFGAIVLVLPYAASKNKILTAVAAASFAIIFIGLLAYNSVRFGNPFEFGNRYLVSGGPLLQNGHLFSVDNLWRAVCTYLFCVPKLGGVFPFVSGLATPNSENAFGMALCTPFVLCAARCWLATGMLRRFLLATMISVAAVTVTICLCWHQSVRYEAEFSATLILLAAIGVLAIEERGLIRWRWFWISTLALSVAFNLLMDYRLQGESAKVEAYAALNRWGDVPRADACYRRALNIDQEHHEAQNQYGMLLLRTGATYEAAQHFQRATEIAPDWPEPRINFAVALLQLGQCKEALAQLDLVAHFDPGKAAQVREWQRQILVASKQ